MASLSIKWKFGHYKFLAQIKLYKVCRVFGNAKVLHVIREIDTVGLG